MNSLSLKKISKRYRIGNEEIEVFKEINIDIEEGEKIAVMGPSGAGKTTLLHIMGTILKPTEGKVFIDGIEVSSMDDESMAGLRSKKIGFVFQFHHLLPEFTSLENVMMPLIIKGKMGAEERARESLELVGLRGRENHRPSQLSGGERQRVAVARAIVGRPSILLADEPTGNLDWKTSEELMSLLLKIHRKLSMTTVIVSHSRKVAEKCGKIYLLDRGELTCCID